MEQLVGSQLDRKPIEFEWVKDLVSYEGPLLSLFKSGAKKYLFHWCDCDEVANRWMVVEIDDRNYHRALAGECRFRELLDKALVGSFVFVFDRNANQQETYWLVSGDDVPQHYLPDSSVFIEVDEPDRLIGDDEAVILFDLGGGISALNQFLRWYHQIYNLLYGMKTGQLSQIQSRPWGPGDGWSSYHFSEDLRKSIPPEDRASESELLAASPGICKLSTSAGLADDVHEIIKNYSLNKAVFDSLYHELHKLIIAGSFESFTQIEAISRFDKDEDIAIAREAFVSSLWSDEQYNALKSGRSHFEATKILLASFRRIRNIHRDFESQEISSVRWKLYTKSESYKDLKRKDRQVKPRPAVPLRS